MNAQEFVARFPEFRTGMQLIPAVLAEATRSIDAEVFGDRTDDAIGYLAAHLLASSPYGRSQRADGEKEPDTYWKRFHAIRTEVTPPVLVT